MDKEEHKDDPHAGHGHSEPDENIILHQEKLLPTILMAVVLVTLTLFGLAQAGNSKLDISTGQAAFDKVESQKPISQKAKIHSANKEETSAETPAQGH